MAKEKTLTEEMETRVREALEKSPGADKCSEWQYCDAALEALDMVKSGIEMRKQELEGGGDDD